MCCETEFPDYLLQRIINDKSEDVKKAILQTLISRPQLSPYLLDWVASFLERDDSTDSKETAINILGKQIPLSEDILQAIVTRLEHSNKSVRRSAICTLGKQNSLSENILQAIVT